jgi:hypothetical protein
LIDMPGTASRFIPLKRAGAYPTTTGIRQLAQVLTEPVRRGALERWYDFSNKSEETALREWCAENGIELSET